MMQAQIFVHEMESMRRSAIQQQISLLHIDPIDTVSLFPLDDKEGITIDQVKDFNRQLILRPTVSSHRAGVIDCADALNVYAQNALLKILEEPPSQLLFFLGTPAIDLLLPTIVSRCTVILVQNGDPIPADDSSEITKQIESLIQASPATIISTIGPIAVDRITAKKWTIQAIKTLRDILLQDTIAHKQSDRIKRLLSTIKALEHARKELQANVSPKATLELAFLKNSIRQT